LLVRAIPRIGLQLRLARSRWRDNYRRRGARTRAVGCERRVDDGVDPAPETPVEFRSQEDGGIRGSKLGALDVSDGMTVARARGIVGLAAGNGSQDGGHRTTVGRSGHRDVDLNHLVIGRLQDLRRHLRDGNVGRIGEDWSKDASDVWVAAVRGARVVVVACDGVDAPARAKPAKGKQALVLGSAGVAGEILVLTSETAVANV